MQPTPIENIVLSEEERRHYAELRDVLHTAATPGWLRIMQRLEELVTEAHEAMIGAGDAPDIVLAAKSRRWAQREAMFRDIKDYLASCEAESKVILDGLKSDTDRSDPHAEG